MSYKILNSEWYTPNLPGMSTLDQATFGLPTVAVGFVAIETADGKWKCYMGLGNGQDEKVDAMDIAENGQKVSKEVSCAHFPELDPERFVF